MGVNVCFKVGTVGGRRSGVQILLLDFCLFVMMPFWATSISQQQKINTKSPITDS